MSRPIIQIEGLGKKYRLHHQTKERYTTLRDTLARSVKGMFRPSAKAPGEKSSDEDFWALKDLNFEVNEGDVVGIIGRNGAGKSTLLKVLSRITEPTTGRITLRGRVASLLEVGTGFHPELTGRENIYLNGAILGMRKAEIKAKFDEIVAFAEVERFLDTPVKRYSSGMYVRLAFAVAAHLEPEILVVDEVLAVGDAEFQKKCLGKMKEVSKKGRTVLFVSHQLDTIRSLCSRAILLSAGTVGINGDVDNVINSYLKSSQASSIYQKEKSKEKLIQILSASLDESGISNHKIIVAATIQAMTEKMCSLDVRLTDALGCPVGYGSFGTLCSSESLILQKGTNEFRFAMDTSTLAEGAFALSLDLTHPNVEYYDRAEHCLEFTITQNISNGRTRAFMQNWGHGSTELRLHRLQPKVYI